MEAIHQVYEKIPSVITIPAEILDRHVRVIFEPLDEEPNMAALAADLGMKPKDILDPGILKFAGCMPDFKPLPELDNQDLEAKAARFGLKLEEVADLHALKFIGCLPDFPLRAPQGEYEDRPELDLL